MVDRDGYVLGIDSSTTATKAVLVRGDGTVAGVAKTYRQGDQATFWALLSERLLTPGDHELAFHAVSGPRSDPALSPPTDIVRLRD